VLSDEALQDLKDYYVSVRAQGKGADAPVPITARQLEALVRLAEACARARLSDVVNAEDAQRAIHVVQSFLERVATAEGKLDIDMIQTGVSHGQRERLELLQEIMRGLQAEKGAFSLEEVKDLAERQGIPPARSEALFHALRNQGDLMESRPGQWQLVRF
jgi:replicative DNA helicase Mcm